MEIPFFLGTPWSGWLIAAAAAAAGLWTLRGYRRRASGVKAPRLRLMKTLRLAAWVLLFLCLLQPMHRRYIREQRASRITVLVDDSESMSFADRPKGPSRTARARALLEGQALRPGLQKRLARSFKVKLERFSASARPIEKLEELSAQGPRTDIARALSDAYGRLKGPDAGGLILISDGADTVHGDWAPVARKFRRAGIPIYAVGLGAPDVPDLAVTQVRCRRTVRKDTLVRVEVDVTRTRVPPGERIVRITRNGRTIKETKLDLRSEKGRAIFEFLPAEQGFLEYKATVLPYHGELVTSNNTLVFGLVAFSRKLKVLYMEGSQHRHSLYGRRIWRDKWEHEFLVDALEEDRDVEVDVLFRDRPEEYEGPIKTVKAGYPKTKKALYQYDVIISSDIPFDHFNDDQVQWTVDFVAKHGGGFIMVGGWHAFGEGGYGKTKFDRMLPVEMSRFDGHRHEQDTPWRVTEEGWAHPIMRIDKDPEKNHKIWAMLNTIGGTEAFPKPAFQGYSETIRPKPAATTLAVIGDEELEGAFGPMVLVAVQPFGRGRSMAFTSDCTGGWGAVWEDSWGDDPADPDRRNIYYKTFWKNAIRWLAHYRMQAPNQLVQLETDRLVYGRGEIPQVRVKVLTPDYEPTHEAKVSLRITAPSGKKRTVTVFPQYVEPGVYERKLELDAVGRYGIEAFADWRGEEIGRDQALLQVRPSTEELRQLSQNVEALTQLAKASGGAYIPIEEAAGLGERLRQDTHEIQRFEDEHLWDRWWVFVLIVGLFCTEWFYRKRSGLP